MAGKGEGPDLMLRVHPPTAAQCCGQCCGQVPSHRLDIREREAHGSGSKMWPICLGCVRVWEAVCLSLSSANDPTPSLEAKQRGLTSSQREVHRWAVQAGFSQAQEHVKAKAFSFPLAIPRRLVYCI